MDPTTQTQLEDLMSHSAWLRGLAEKLVGDPATADDLVQETWLAALRRPPDPERPAKPWLAGVMRKLVAMRARGEGRRMRRQQAVAQAEALPSTATMVEDVDTQRRISRAVLALAEPYRTMVLLRYYRQMSAAEIARRQGLPSGTVRWRLRRGLEELRAGLDQEWPDRKSWCLAVLALERSWQGACVAAGVQATSGLAWLSLLSSFQWPGLLLLTVVLGWLGLGFLASDADDQRDPPVRSAALARDAGDPLVPPFLDERVVALPEARDPGALARGSRPAPADTVASGRRLRILLPDASPARGLLVVLLAADGSVHENLTDDQGYIEAARIDRTATLFVKRPDAFLDRLLLDEHWPLDGLRDPAAEIVVHLPAGVELSGQLVVASHAPDARIALSLTRDQPLFGDLDAPESVRESIRSARIAHCRTDADGSFRFAGLAADWHGTLRLPAGYRFASGTTSDARVLALAGPATRLRVELDPGRQLVGRLVGGDGRPTTGLVECVFSRPSGRTRTVKVEADHDGGFRTTIRASAVSVVVRVQGPGGIGLVTRSLEGDAHVDLGSIGMLPARRLSIEVSDESGRPLEGAEVRLSEFEGVGTLWSGLTGPAGGVECEFPSGIALQVLVDTLGYRARRAVMSSGDRLAVELSASPILRVAVVDTQGVTRSAGLRLVGVRPGFRFAAGLDDHALSAGSEGEGSVLLECDRSGQLTIDGFDGDERIEVQVLGPLRNVLGTRAVEFDGLQENAVELRIDGALATFSGSVRDDGGRALVGAAILLTAADGTSCRVRTDREGHFAVLHGEFGAVRVEISKAGFEPLLMYGVRIAAEQGREFVLRSADGE
ncbi:MAG: RNA polymerase sigma-70 factor (ECF subfamily) [Chlamydiales bacterium]|jgi:RNA polymerase sigma-70 factor (ECF subfamily)